MTETATPTSTVDYQRPGPRGTHVPMPGLPPGPRTPAWLQSMGAIYRQRPLVVRTKERFGDLYTVRLAGMGNFVSVGHPDLVREVLR
ncbi:MAG: hypothetical protein REI11_16210, partial [Patulibacter sp.]|nr:hypothetical protein [Patulibacter sp.]